MTEFEFQHFIATEIARGRSAPRHEELAPHISEVTLRTSTTGAATLTVLVIDSEWALFTSGWLDTNDDGVFENEIEVQYPPGRYWRLCMADISDDLSSANLTLTFEDRIVAYLRDKWGPKTVAPGTTTRAQFVKQLVDEVGRGDGLPPIKFVCPSINVVQKVAVTSAERRVRFDAVTILPPAKHADVERRANKGRGIGRGAAITIKGAAPTAAQLDLVNEVLDVANNLKAGTLATLGLLEACIQENDFTNNPGGGGGSTGLLQLIPSTASELGVDPLNVRQVVAAFLTKTQGGAPGGAMEYARTHPGASPDAVAQAVQASGAGASFYAQWEHEARAILAAYGGLASGSQSIESLNAAIKAAPAKSDVSQLTRGTSDNPDEDSWDCMGRLAQDVRWFAFSNADTLYYMDGPDLIAQTPRAFLARGRDAEPRWNLIDGDAKDPSATDCVASITGTVDNTTFVYRSTHRRKGRMRRAARRIAKPSTPTEVQLSLVCDIGYAHAGDVFVLVDCGPLSGRWIVTDATRNIIADTFTSFTLGPPTAPEPEPQATAGDIGQTTIPTGTPAGSDPTITDPGKLAGVVQAARKALAERSKYVYSEGPDRGNGGTLFGPAPRTMDCSAFATLCYKAAGLPDPNHENYSPIGYTGSFIPHCKRVENPEPGDVCFYGSSESATTHMTVYIGNSECISHGSPGDPIVLDAKYRSDFLGFYRSDVVS